MIRSEITSFQDIPNVGKTTIRDFSLLGIKAPIDLAGLDPWQMYRDLCAVTAKRHDPCIIDVFISAVRYREGGPPKKWWEFTRERKASWQDKIKNRET